MTVTAPEVTVPAGLEFDPATDPARRRHLVLAMPWGAQIDPRHADVGGHTLERGDVLVDRELARQGFVNVDHLPGTVGYIVDAVEDETGVWSVVQLTEEGEQVFADGNGDVSAEIIQPGLRWYFSGLALVSKDEEPAIPGSRVVFSNKPYAAFAVSSQKGSSMTAQAPEANKQAPEIGPEWKPDFQAYLKDLGEKTVESHNQLVKSLGDSIGESVAAGFKVALETIKDPQAEGPSEVRAARFHVTREAPVYDMNGSAVGFSLVKDAWHARMEHDDDAAERIKKYRLQTEEIAKLATHALRFTTSTTSNASQVIPPGYRPDLYVPQLQQGRPLVSLASQGVITNATPFTVPTFASVSGATADHVEGTNPTDGTLTFGTKTVTPGGISGKMVITREIADSSNPAIDLIALASMRESYARQTDGKVYTLLNGANGAGGTITAGFVPSGAQASTYATTGGTPAESAAIKGIRQEIARYPFNRFAYPSMGALGANAAKVLAGALDTTGRPLYPWVTLAGDAVRAGDASTTGWMIDGVPFLPAWSITGTAAGDTQILFVNRSDLWVWESPTLTFRFEEKSGPALIELALFGYFGTHLLRPVGLNGIRLT